jgi:hypothetical protein
MTKKILWAALIIIACNIVPIADDTAVANYLLFVLIYFPFCLVQMMSVIIKERMGVKLNVGKHNSLFQAFCGLFLTSLLIQPLARSYLKWYLIFFPLATVYASVALCDVFVEQILLSRTIAEASDEKREAL